MLVTANLFEMKFKRDPRIDEYIENAPTFAKPILNRLRKVIHQSCPEVEETVKWGKPWFMYQGKVMCGLVAFKAHMAFLFNNAGSMDRDHSHKPAIAKGQLRRITSFDDLPNDKILKSHIKHAMKLNEPGAKRVKRVIKRKPPVKTPTELMMALRANPKALAKYEKLTESNKRHYVDWINDAKTETTRETRLEKSVDCIAAGKTRHWE
jgi:uncharacterized protein YdeI (YjbR/CyaY-like superfamily)